MPDDKQITALLAAHPYDRITDVPAFVVAMGAAIHQSGFFGCVNEAQGRVIALDCLVRKIPPLERAATDHIIGGKLSMRADAMLAEFLERGGKVKWINVGDDGQEARAKFSTTRGSGSEAVSLEVVYTIDMARNAGLIKRDSGWQKNPGEMLRARLTSKAIRMLDPQVVAGRYTPEELDPDGKESHIEATYVPIENTEQTKPLANLVEPQNSGPDKEPQPVQQSAPPSTQQPAAQQALPEIDTEASAPLVTMAQLGRMRDLKTQLGIPDETWRKILGDKYGVSTAKALSEEKAAALIANMEKKLDAKRLEDWANRVQTSPAPPGSVQLNDSNQLVEQPPFVDGSPTHPT